MRRSLFPMVALVGAMFVADATAADDIAGIREVIGDQIAAFRADDLGAAFDFASPMIQRMFHDPETFGRMVRSGYPMIWRPEAVQYFGLREENGRVLQRMGFRDAAGAFHLFDYDMVSGPDGWRINGVYPVAPDDVGV